SYPSTKNNCTTNLYFPGSSSMADLTRSREISRSTVQSSRSLMIICRSSNSSVILRFDFMKSMLLLITILFNQAPKLTSPLNWSKDTKALIKDSCTTSSASSTLFKKRMATANIPSQYCRYNLICACRSLALHFSTNSIWSKVGSMLGLLVVHYKGRFENHLVAKQWGFR